ncbi:MAG TPA: hypothetical protein VIX14_00525 [Terriglobales bacterium]
MSLPSGLPCWLHKLVVRSLLGLAFVFALAFFALVHPQSSVAANAPPIGENAYCGKGDVPRFGENDGPAHLPQSCYYTGMDGTPSPGKQIRVGANSDLHAAVELAKCGDTLLLAAGASFEIKELPAKKCDDQHYITIRTDTPDSKLPPDGTRISPAWAGVATLPGRPAYAQPPGGAAKLMPTLVVKGPSWVNIGDHYRFIGVEWVSEPGIRDGRMVTTKGADHVIFDRNWLHPAEGAEVGKGIGMIPGTRFIAVINSYLSGFHCVARTGACTDASAVGGGYGDDPIRTLKIYNNFLEASGQSILFGGARSEVNPTDIEIRRNHLFKPMIWKEGEPGYTPDASGNPPIVKNHFELKSGIRVLFEANLLENSWGGFSQTGFSILLMPVNQSGKCPKCAVTDVTLRYDRIRNVAGVMEVANPFGLNRASAADGGRYSIHDLLVDSVHDQDWKGRGEFAVVGSNAELLHDVAFDHVTAFVAGPLFYIGNHTAEKIPNFSVTNSLFRLGGKLPDLASIGGPIPHCGDRAQRAGAEAVLIACFVNYKFEKNLIVNARGSFPKGTIVVGSPEAAAIRDLKDTVSKDPRLCHAKQAGCAKASPGAGAASDGRDVGADVDAVEAAIAGVE